MEEYLYYSKKDIPVKLNNSTDIYENIFIYDKNKTYIQNSTFLSFMNFDLNIDFEEKTIIKEKSFLLYSNWAEKAYLHFIEECLPKLNYYLKLRKDSNIKLVIPSERYTNDHDFILKSFGIENKDILFLEDQKLYFFKNLIRSKNYPVFEYSLDKIEIFNKIRKSLDIKKNLNPVKNIYLSRSKQINKSTGNYNIGKTRGINNENILIDFLKKYNFQIIESGNISLKEKCEKLNNANIIITQTGGSSYNLLFCNSPKKLILLSNNTPVGFESLKSYLKDYNLYNSSETDIQLLKYKDINPDIDKSNNTNSPFNINLEDIKNKID